VAAGGPAEGPVDLGAGERGPGGADQGEPAVVVQGVEDLDSGAVGELPVGGVHGPHLVGLGGLEAGAGRLRAFVRLRGDQAAGLEDAPDGADRGGVAVALLQVERDRLRAGVVPVAVELLGIARICSSTSTGVCPGLLRGRRERGCSPASPSARYRCTRVITQRRLTP
jgi:hypothetical protein